jgi:hypothetical protein
MSQSGLKPLAAKSGSRIRPQPDQPTLEAARLLIEAVRKEQELREMKATLNSPGRAIDSLEDKPLFDKQKGLFTND